MQTEATRSRHLTQQELATRWNKSVHTIERYRTEGVGPVYLKIGGKVNFKTKHLNEWVNADTAWMDTQPSSGVEQHHRTEKTGGTVRMFIGSTALSIPEKRQKEAWVASQMQQAAQSDAWATPGGFQSLALEHKLVAARGDFLNVYAAMTLIDPNAAAPSGSGENTGPPAARLVLHDLAQLATYVAADGSVNDFAVTELLRRAGCLEQLPADADQRVERTEEMRDAVVAFGVACVKLNATVADVIAPIIKARVFKVDYRWK